MREKEEPKQEEKVWKLEIASLGLVIQILRKPTVADFDKSGTISAGEALLGIALSVDSFGAGIECIFIRVCTAMMAILVAVMSSLFLFIGMKLGTVLSNMKWLQNLHSCLEYYSSLLEFGKCKYGRGTLVSRLLL